MLKRGPGAPRGTAEGGRQRSPSRAPFWGHHPLSPPGEALAITDRGDEPLFDPTSPAEATRAEGDFASGEVGDPFSLSRPARAPAEADGVRGRPGNETKGKKGKSKGDGKKGKSKAGRGGDGQASGPRHYWALRRQQRRLGEGRGSARR